MFTTLQAQAGGAGNRLTIFQQSQLNKNFQTAFTLHNKNNYELAIDYYHKALQWQPSNFNIRYLLGLAYYAAGYTKNAVIEWESLMKLGGNDAVLLQKIALAYQLQSLNKVSNSAPHRKLNLLSRIDLINVKGALEKGFKVLLPTSITVDSREVITVMDGKTGVIAQLNGDGVHLSNVLGFYEQSFFATSKLSRPYDFIRAANGIYFVSDFRKDSIVGISPEGEKLFEWNDGSEPPIAFRGPKGMSFDGDGNILVADSGVGEVKVLNPNGQLINTIGALGSYAGQLKMPSDVYFSAHDNSIYVLDAGNKRLQSFDSYGGYIEEFSLAALAEPTRIIADPQQKNSFLLLDKKQLYRFYIPSKQLFPVLVDEDDSVVRPRNYLSAVIDGQGKAYLGNAAAGTIDVYGEAFYLYENLKVHTQKIILDNFPTVVVQVSVKNFVGQPVGQMKVKDFQILENGVNKTLRRVVGSQGRQKFRPVVLVEKTFESAEKEKQIQNFLQALFAKTDVIDSVQLVGFGGAEGDAEGQAETISSFTKLRRMAISKLLAAPPYSKPQASKALLEAITRSLSHGYKRAIVLLAFSKYNSSFLGGMDYQILLDYAAHNQIPIYIVDANLAANTGDLDGRYLQNIAEVTGGKYFRFTGDVVESLLKAMGEYENGVYQFSYTTSKRPLTEGAFRNVEVRANFQSLSGVDDKFGYPIP